MANAATTFTPVKSANCCASLKLFSQSIMVFAFNAENAKNAEKRREISSSLRNFAGSAASALKVLSYLYRHTHVAEARPCQTVERGHVLCHFVEQAFDGHKIALAGDVVNQLAQKFPLRPRVAGRLDGFHELLDAALGVRKRAALLGVCATGQQIMRQLGCHIWQNVAHDEHLQFA